MKDILHPIESKNIDKPEIPKEKNLDQMTLPERAAVLQEAMELIAENPEMTEEEQSVFDSIKMSVEEKALAWGYVIKQYQESIELIKKENDFYKQKQENNKKRIDVIENRIKSRAAFLQQLMHDIGKKKIEGANYSVLLKKQVDKLMFDSEDISTKNYPKNLYEDVPSSIKWKANELKKYLKENESDDFHLEKQPFKLVVK